MLAFKIRPGGHKITKSEHYFVYIQCSGIAFIKHDAIFMLVIEKCPIRTVYPVFLFEDIF